MILELIFLLNFSVWKTIPMNNDLTLLKEICFHTGEDVQLFQMVDVILE